MNENSQFQMTKTIGFAEIEKEMCCFEEPRD